MQLVDGINLYNNDIREASHTFKPIVKKKFPIRMFLGI